MNIHNLVITNKSMQLVKHVVDDDVNKLSAFWTKRSLLVSIEQQALTNKKVGVNDAFWYQSLIQHSDPSTRGLSFTDRCMGFQCNYHVSHHVKPCVVLRSLSPNTWNGREPSFFKELFCLFRSIRWCVISLCMWYVSGDFYSSQSRIACSAGFFLSFFLFFSISIPTTT